MVFGEETAWFGRRDMMKFKSNCNGELDKLEHRKTISEYGIDKQNTIIQRLSDKLKMLSFFIMASYTS